MLVWPTKKTDNSRKQKFNYFYDTRKYHEIDADIVFFLLIEIAQETDTKDELE
jgi:hypothetical protein